MTLEKSKALKIGIIGGGFSGVSLAANLHRLSESQGFLNQRPIEIYLFEKTGNVGAGDAYRTPFPYHLLNIRAENMSAFEDDPSHFVNWITSNQTIDDNLDPTKPLSTQFVPRLCFRHYLKHLLEIVSDHDKSGEKLKFIIRPHEVINVLLQNHQAQIVLENGENISVDKVVLATGNLAPSHFPFPVENMKCILNPWDYKAPEQIASDEPVLIVGTGLSMIDVVLTLHHHAHRGKIYAVSRHGLMPLPHGEDEPSHYKFKEDLSTDVRTLTKQLRLIIKNHINDKGDWRSIMNAYREKLPETWSSSSVQDKERFLRHVLPYWNIHRHRVHHKISDLLTEKLSSQQFSLLSGRVISVKDDIATIRIRKTHEIKQIKTNWVINCMGPSLNMKSTKDKLITSLLEQGALKVDPFKLGFMTDAMGALQDKSGNSSSMFYALGPLRKGMVWESTAVPGIRKQSKMLAIHLLRNDI
jgi:uncharacterized NAD(P)/FAD-binding protein YdhS